MLEAIAAHTAAAIAGLRHSERLTTQLRERVSELQGILSNMSDALLITDADGRIVSLNQAARELLSVDDLTVVLGQPLQQQVSGQWPLGAREITDTLAPLLAALERGDEPADAEVRLGLNRHRVLSFSGTRKTDNEGRTTGCVLIV